MALPAGTVRRTSLLLLVAFPRLFYRGSAQDRTLWDISSNYLEQTITFIDPFKSLYLRRDRGGLP